MSTARWATVVIMVMVACLWSAPTTTEAQKMGCEGSLTMCLSPLRNSSEAPSPSCCVPLKEAVTKQKPCLCNLFNSPDTLKTFNITTEQILSLTARCNISDATPSMCSAVPSPAPAPAPAGTVTPPPPGAGTKAGTGTRNGVASAWSGVSLILAIIISFLLF